MKIPGLHFLSADSKKIGCEHVPWENALRSVIILARTGRARESSCQKNLRSQVGGSPDEAKCGSKMTAYEDSQEAFEVSAAGLQPSDVAPQSLMVPWLTEVIEPI